MSRTVQRIAVWGSTGSIGVNTLDVARAAKDRLQVVAISAYSKLDELVAQACEFKPRWVVAADETRAADFDWSCLPRESELIVGPRGLDQVARQREVDTVVAAIAGMPACAAPGPRWMPEKGSHWPTRKPWSLLDRWSKQELPKRVAQILPVDSEHSAIFQALAAGRREDVERIILTASGGPFRTFDKQQLSQVTVEQALEHPTWDMGPKITIDSATMMNKALEIVEARWLFDVSAEQIEVLVHPQSVIHSLVQFVDGSVVAQMSPPDMRLPIQYALSYPERWATTTVPWDRSQRTTLTLEPADTTRFPAIELGLEVARAGGTAGVIMNASNEAAVAEFMAGRLPFVDIVPACRSVLENHQFDPQPSLEELFELDAWARAEVTRWVCT